MNELSIEDMMAIEAMVIPDLQDVDIDDPDYDEMDDIYRLVEDIK